MAKWEQNETRRIAVTTADKAEEFETLCTGCYLIADADCFVDFNRTAVLNSSFLIKANVQYTLERVMFSELHAVCASTANLYIIAIK